MTLTGNRVLELIGAWSSGCCLVWDILLQRVRGHQPVTFELLLLALSLLCWA